MEIFSNFREIAASWEKEKKLYVKRSTLSAYLLILQNHLLPFFGEMNEIIEDKVQEFVIDKLHSGLSQKSVRDFIIVLKMIVRYGAKKGVMKHPDWDIKYPTEHKMHKLPILSLKDQKKLMNHIMENFTFRNFGILLCLHTGMRIGEICALKWEDIDIKQGLISVNKTLERIYTIEDNKKQTELFISTPKTKNACREIPMTKDLIKIFTPLKKVVTPDFYVLTNEKKPTEPRTYRNYYKNLLFSLEIPPIKFHGLRHSFATRCIESKCDYKTVSVILGHSDISTTLNLYVHPNNEQKKKCIDKMIKSLGNI